MSAIATAVKTLLELSATERNEALEVVQALTTPTRRRGRPKGSKNKTHAMAAEGETPTPKKRGRPRKNAVATGPTLAPEPVATTWEPKV